MSGDTRIEQKTVLLVDDVRLFLNLEETFFRRTGCRVLTAMSGEEALRVIRKEHPDAVLLDFVMPGMNGDEVCKEVKADPELSNTIVIIVTTKGDVDSKQRCLEAGCDDFVLKPVNQKDLLEKVAQHLDLDYRVHFRILVRIEVEGRWREGFFMGESSDLSRSGMLLVTEAPLDENDRLNVQFVIPGRKEPVSVHGSVVRMSTTNVKPGYKAVGVQFEDLPAAVDEAITEFINSRR